MLKGVIAANGAKRTRIKIIGRGNGKEGGQGGKAESCKD